MLSIRSAIGGIRERYARPSGEIDFFNTGQLSPKDFMAAGQYLKERFGIWDWHVEPDLQNKIDGLDDDKHILVCRNLPCRRRLDDNVAGHVAEEATMVIEGDDFRDATNKGALGDDEDGWLKTGDLIPTPRTGGGDVRTIDDSGNLGEPIVDEMDDIPDMDDEEDDKEALLVDRKALEPESESLREYNVYITYSALYKTPRMFLSGYYKKSPIHPNLMMEDVMGDYHNKTVTIEAFPHFSKEHSVYMLCVHACRHASVMKSLIHRADQALKLQREKQKLLQDAGEPQDVKGLADDLNLLKLGRNGEDEWEVVEDGDGTQDEVAIRVDQYLVVFLKFMASVIPAIELDNTMAI